MTAAQFDKLAEKAADHPRRPFTLGDCLKLIGKAGFVLERQGGTSHAVYKHKETGVQFFIVKSGDEKRELLGYEVKQMKEALRAVVERTKSIQLLKALAPIKDKPKDRGMDR